MTAHKDCPHWCHCRICGGFKIQGVPYGPSCSCEWYFGLPPGFLSESTAERMRKLMREVWHQRSWQKKAALKRATDTEGFTVCELCRKRAPKVHVDHIVPCGDKDADFLQRLFVNPDGLKVLCIPCHNSKTSCERIDFFAVPKPRAPRKKKKRR